MTKLNISILIFEAILFLSAGFVISQMIGTTKVDAFVVNILEKEKSIPNTEQDIAEDCKDLSLIDTAVCLRDNIKTFYKYIPNGETYYDVETLKTIGGDCYNYAKLYESLGQQLGFNSARQYAAGIDEVLPPHTWTIIWDETHYCKLDQLVVECYERSI